MCSLLAWIILLAYRSSLMSELIHLLCEYEQFAYAYLNFQNCSKFRLIYACVSAKRHCMMLRLLKLVGSVRTHQKDIEASCK